MGGEMLDSPVYFRECFRIIERDWGAVLHPSSKAIVWMVLDRTIGWGKKLERIPLRHFTDGILSAKSGMVIHPGTGLSRATVSSRLAELLSWGTLIRHGQCVYEIDFEWRPEIVGLRKSDYKTPAKGGLKISTKMPKNQHGGVLEIRPYKREKEEERTKIRGKAALRQSPNELQENLTQIERRATARSMQRMQKVAACAGVPKASLLGHMWMDAVQACYPESILPTMTHKAMGMLRQYAFRFCRMRGPKEQRLPFENFSSYVDWVILEWRLIMDNRFSWCDNIPLIPDIRFYVGMANHFERAWEERRQLEALRKMTPREAFHTRLVDGGLTEEAADRAVSERFRVDEEREALERERKALKQERLALQREGVQQVEAKVRKEKQQDMDNRRAGYRTGETAGFVWNEDVDG